MVGQMTRTRFDRWTQRRFLILSCRIPRQIGAVRACSGGAAFHPSGSVRHAFAAAWARAADGWRVGVA
eukprot:11168748-Lingulodinium_polyedra.AAC.1